MKSDICPLCAVTITFTPNNNKDNSHLHDVIYKYLQITINKTFINNVCDECETTIINWDVFVQKCWETQNLFQQNSDYSNSIKLEPDNNYIEIKIENSTETYNSDYIDNTEDDSKFDDPLSSMKSEENKTNEERKKKLRHKKKHRDSLHSKCDKKSKKQKYSSSSSRDDNKYIRKKTTSSFIEYICHICHINFKGWTLLKRHCLSDHQTRAKILCICGKYLSSSSAIQAHRVAHDESQKDNFKCNQCGKVCFDSRGLNHHVMANHTPEEEYPYGCDQCPKRFFVLRLFKEHMAKHLPPDLQEKFLCHICNTTLGTRGSLRTHIATVHNNDENHICDICGLNYSSKGNLKTHRLTHTDKKEFNCDKCSKQFKSKLTLSRHEQIHNEGVYKCPLCPVISKTPRRLQAHKRIHTSVLKHICKICGKKFRTKGHLEVHVDSHNGVKSSKCPWCPKTFANNQNVKLHIKHVHLKEWNESNICRYKEMPPDISMFSGMAYQDNSAAIKFKSDENNMTHIN